MAICLKFGMTETKAGQTTYEATSVLVEQIRCDGAVGKKDYSQNCQILLYCDFSRTVLFVGRRIS